MWLHNRGTGDLATRGLRASFPASLPLRLGAALRRVRGGNDRRVRVRVGEGREAAAGAGAVVPIAGSLRFTAWKARHLVCYPEAPGRGRTPPADYGPSA